MTSNVDDIELAKFEDAAHAWWDPNGAFKTLHDINPARTDYIESHVRLSGKRVLDIGCGGGILCEEMSRRGAEVTGIDAGSNVIAVARLHQLESGAQTVYKQTTAEAFLTSAPPSFDVVTCLELLEHVPNPRELVATCAALVRPGGHVFFSTINRNPKAWLMAVLGAEYLLRLIPKGTHDYKKLIRPSELARWIRATDLELREFKGMRYNPFTGVATLSANLDLNYLVWAER